MSSASEHSVYMEDVETEPEDEATLDDKLALTLFPFHFTSPKSVRDMMADTGAVISGSAALAMLHFYSFDPVDLDFYVPARGFATVLRFVSDYGYQITPAHCTASPYNSNRLVVVKLVHSGSQKSINVITGIAPDEHVVHMIARFHSTVVMNFIAHYGVVSLYPGWTLQQEGLIVVDTSRTWSCFAKYEDRGFRLCRNIAELSKMSDGHQCGCSPYCPATERTLHDRTCHLEPFLDTPRNRSIAFYEPAARWTLVEPGHECI